MLTKEQIEEINNTPKTHGVETMLAKKFGVSRMTIYNYRHLAPTEQKVYESGHTKPCPHCQAPMNYGSRQALYASRVRGRVCGECKAQGIQAIPQPVVSRRNTNEPLTKNCPDCNNVITYSSFSALSYSIRNNTRCKECRKGEESERTRSCPMCSKSIVYQSNSIYKRAVEGNMVCQECCGKKKTANSQRYYWTKVQDDAAIQFRDEPDINKCEEIYNTYLKEPIQKLVSSTFNTRNYDAIKLSVSIEEAIRIGESWVFSNGLRDMDLNKGRPFSYLSVIVRNYYIQWNINLKAERERVIRLEDMTSKHIEESEYEQDTLSCLESNDKYHAKVDLKEFIQMFTEYAKQNRTKIIGKTQRQVYINNSKAFDAVISAMNYQEELGTAPRLNLHKHMRSVLNTGGDVNYQNRVLGSMVKRIHKHYKIAFKNYCSTGLIG